MNRAHAPRRRVPQQKDDAVGGKDHQLQPRHIRHQSVGSVVHRAGKSLARVAGGDVPDCVLMDLPGQRQSRCVHPYGGAEPAVILIHQVRRVRRISVAAQVQGGIDALADAAQTGGKAVADRPVLQQGGGMEGHAVFLVCYK